MICLNMCMESVYNMAIYDTLVHCLLWVISHCVCLWFLDNTTTKFWFPVPFIKLAVSTFASNFFCHALT